MPENRVSVTLTFTTDDPAGSIQRRVIECLHPYLTDRLEAASVHAYDLAEADIETPTVHLVVDPHGGGMNAWVDNAERAADYANHILAALDPPKEDA